MNKLIKHNALLRQEIDWMWEKISKNTEELHSMMKEGKIYRSVHGDFILRDNFKNTNVVYRPAAVRRFEIVQVKPSKKKSR